MTTVLAAKQYIVNLIENLSLSGVEIFYGPNSQSQGFVTIEVLGIQYQHTEVKILGRGAPLSREENYDIAVAIMVKQTDGSLADVETSAKNIYAAIDDAILADPYLGNIVITGGALCQPEDLLSGYLTEPTALLTFRVNCTARF